MLKKILFWIGLSIFVSLYAQQVKPCSIPEARQFDFWVGKWQAEWKDDNGGGKAVNNVSVILDSCVIFEQFEGTVASPLKGKSVSSYNARTGKWQQTWVDNQGSYLEFSGQWEGDKMILTRSFDLKGKTVMQRMVWYNIEHKQFDWNWERSDDMGETWNVNWQIHYTREM